MGALSHKQAIAIVRRLHPGQLLDGHEFRVEDLLDGDGTLDALEVIGWRRRCRRIRDDVLPSLGSTPDSDAVYALVDAMMVAVARRAFVDPDRTSPNDSGADQMREWIRARLERHAGVRVSLKVQQLAPRAWRISAPSSLPHWNGGLFVAEEIDDPQCADLWVREFLVQRARRA